MIRSDKKSLFVCLSSSNRDLHPRTIVLQPKPGIGDMIWQLPTLKALAADDPTGTIDLVVHEELPVRALLGNEGIINKVLSLPMKNNLMSRVHAVLRLLWALPPRNYQRIFILHHSARYAFAARMMNIPCVHGWGLGAQRFLLTQPPTLMPSHYQTPIFPRELGKNLLAKLDIPVNDAFPHLHLDAAVVNEVLNEFSGFPKPWIGFGIGSKEKRRIWPQDRFAAVADALWASGYRSLFLLGTANEHCIAERIANYCRIAKPALVTDLSLDRTIALMSQCTFNFCTDSGLMNVSVVVKVPVYVLFATLYRFVYSPMIRPIVAECELDIGSGAEAITVARALTKLREDGIINNN